MLPGIASMMLLGDAAGVSGGGGGGGGGYAGGTLDTQTITVGADGTAINENRRRGFILAALGGINDGTSNLYSGAAVRRISAEEAGGGDYNINFEVAGVQANSGWTSMTINGGTPLNRASATFSTAGGNTRWTWGPFANPFGQSGTKVIGFD